ncbi:Pkinase-domain-containing protein [Zopfochytrium polystomum]|nr:Pkinase-domain-containing protein [Zopfochytrium polystomum]
MASPNFARAASSTVPTTWPLPGSTIHDKKKGDNYRCGEQIGEGGFARCFEFYDRSGYRVAAKVIPKSSLTTNKQKQKLFAEIKIHQSLSHPGIVGFRHVFEDERNVYILLELCENRTMVEYLKARKRLTDPEVRYYMWHLFDTVRYMQKERVIHRDIKLGNMFLTIDMTVKIGDFDGDRKKTICGTPNYIAPEVLFDTQTGHSFEVDMWSLGVVMYTLLIGRPPFQTKEVKAIYKRIRDISYDFPSQIPISDSAKSVIQALLSREPESRPSVEELINHDFFTRYTIVPSIPTTALKEIPDFSTPAPPSTISVRGRISYFETQNENRPPLPPPRSIAGKEALRRTSTHSLRPTPTPEPGQVPTPPDQDLPELNSASEGKQRPPTPVRMNSAPPPQPLAAKPFVNNAIDGHATESIENQQPEYVPVPVPENNERQTVIGGVLEAMYENICKGCDRHRSDELETVDDISAPSLIVTKWIDYSNKYGIGYQLRDGSMGVHFNDSTSLLIAADNNHVEYLYYANGGTSTTKMKRRSFLISEYPSELEKKMTLLKQFGGYMRDRLFQSVAGTDGDEKMQTSGLVFLMKYLRTRHGVVFRLSNNVVQLNLFDHTKIIISQRGRVVTYIDENRAIVSKRPEDFIAAGPSKAVEKIHYAKDILHQMIIKRRQRG